MKILLSGDPRVGKTTLLQKIVDNNPYSRGLLTKEVVGLNGERTGFDLVDHTGRRAVLARVSSTSSLRVSRYGADTEQLDDFLEEMTKFSPEALIYIDEIGQMELFSDLFKEYVRNVLAMPNDFIGTITNVYEDDFTKAIRSRKDITFIHVTLENRDKVAKELGKLFG